MRFAPTKPVVKFGMLTLLGPAESHVTSGGHVQACATYRCDCGAIKIMRTQPVREGRVKSCGCATTKLAAEAHTTHGMSSTRVYFIWTGMRKRTKEGGHPRYAGRGITICDRWIDDFAAFYADMGEPPSLMHSIERIDNDKEYSPGNCKWATPQEQALNTARTRRNNNGVPIANLAKERGLCTSTVLGRIKKSGMTLEEALDKPAVSLIEFKGVSKTMQEWADFLGVKYATLYARVVIEKSPLVAALVPGRKRTIKPERTYIFNGATLCSSEICQALGITKAAFSHKLQRGVIKLTRVT